MSVTITLPNDVAEKLFKKLEWSDDCGPKSEGWQSQDYIFFIAVFKEAIANQTPDTLESNL